MNYSITPEAQDAVLRILAEARVTTPPGPDFDWQAVALAVLEAALPYVGVTDPPISQRQNELDGEYVLAMRAQALAADTQRRAAEMQMDQLRRLATTVDLQEQLARRALKPDQSRGYCRARLEPMKLAAFRPDPLSAGPTGDIYCTEYAGHEQPVYDTAGGWWDHACRQLATFWTEAKPGEETTTEGIRVTGQQDDE